MTHEEEHRLIQLIGRIAGQPVVAKDPDAVGALAQLLQVRPDAAYWLLLHCLRLEAAVEQGLAALSRGLPSGPSVPAGPDRTHPEPQLRDLLGEFTHTSLLADLSGGDPQRAQDASAAPGGPRRA